MVKAMSGTNKKYKILVTGGNGVIGKPLCDELRRRGHEVWVCEPYQSNLDNFIKCDVRYFQDVERIFKNHKFQTYLYRNSNIQKLLQK